MPLVASRDELLNRADFAIVIAIELAGIGLGREAYLSGLGLKALFHSDKEGIGVGLGDKTDDFTRRRLPSTKA